MKRNKKLNLNKIFHLLKNNYLLTLFLGFIYFLFLYFYSLPIKNNILNQSTLVIKFNKSNNIQLGKFVFFDDTNFDTSCKKNNFRNFNFFDAIKICLADHLKTEFLKNNITTELKGTDELYLYSNEKLNKDIIKKQTELVLEKIFKKKVTN